MTPNWQAQIVEQLRSAAALPNRRGLGAVAYVATPEKRVPLAFSWPEIEQQETDEQLATLVKMRFEMQTVEVGQ